MPARRTGNITPLTCFSASRVPLDTRRPLIGGVPHREARRSRICIPGGGHGANDVPETVRWLNRNLLGDARAEALESIIEAYSYVTEGRQLARAGDFSGALQAYQNAGSLLGHAAEVMAACEQAVALAPDHAGIRESRGLARALTGDVAGAIDDFEAFVAWTGSDRSRAQRQDWIDALRAGQNPFTPELLERLRN